MDWKTIQDEVKVSCKQVGQSIQKSLIQEEWSRQWRSEQSCIKANKSIRQHCWEFESCSKIQIMKDSWDCWSKDAAAEWKTFHPYGREGVQGVKYYKELQEW